VNEGLGVIRSPNIFSGRLSKGKAEARFPGEKNMDKARSEATGSLGITVQGEAPTRVEEVMTREVVTLAPDHSFQEAITLVARHRFRHLLVVSADQRLAGVISDRDLLRFMIRNPNRETSTVADVMKTDPVTVGPETSLATAIAEMLTRRINCLPVVDEGWHLVGILTSTDLLRDFQKIQERIEGVDLSEV
jgi:acetoin utilization protein AcuB